MGSSPMVSISNKRKGGITFVTVSKERRLEIARMTDKSASKSAFITENDRGTTVQLEESDAGETVELCGKKIRLVDLV